jgi:hypothetical protein
MSARKRSHADRGNAMGDGKTESFVGADFNIDPKAVNKAREELDRIIVKSREQAQKKAQPAK